MDYSTAMNTFNRRQFIGVSLKTAATVSVAATLTGQSQPAETKPERKIKLGVVGCGGRGRWITRLFHKHGGYEIHAVADYFQSVADASGDEFGVDKGRRFSTLSGYKRVIESGIEAIALEVPPYFFPEQARAAVDAGLHVYMAKPVAVDVPGCLTVEAAANKATAAKKVFLVDYQIPTDAANIEVVKRIQSGEIGSIATLNSQYYAGLFPDPPFAENYEGRLQSLIWVNDVAVGGSYHVNACIHAVDAALWVAGARPVKAVGYSQRSRPDPHGDSHDVFSLIFEYPNGLFHHHRGKHLNNQHNFDVFCQVQGVTGFAQIGYGGKAFCRSAADAFEGEVPNLYEAGASRNIAKFHTCVVTGNCANDTVRRSIDGALATILGREAGRRRAALTMAELIQQNQRLEPNLKGLKG